MLDRYCKALGWQGGTANQIVAALEAAKRVVIAHNQASLDGDWDNFIAAVYSLKGVVQGSINP